MSAGTMHTISSHTGKEYERGLLPSAPVTTLPHPGVEVVDGRELESVGGTGLSSRPSAQSNVKSRKPAKQLPARMGPVWKCVTITVRRLPVRQVQVLRKGLQWWRHTH